LRREPFIVRQIPNDPMIRFGSLILFFAVWWFASLFAGPQMLPGPDKVLSVIVVQARTGELFFQVGITLARVFAAFALAMIAGTALGFVMGRTKLADALGDPWLIVLLNLPALVIIVLAFIWGGLTEVAGVLAVAINKLPNTIVMVREGARALDPQLDEMAKVFALPRWKALRHVILPQLAPYIAAAARSGLSLVWKIVLVVELLGRPNGVGFEIGTAFQLFDVTRILAYALAFVVVILLIETVVVQPIERRASRWRTKAA
jgi:NitT/TauT family transport system permease protein